MACCSTPVGWEATLGGVGRPQSFINEAIKGCDYFLLLLWDGWGLPSSSEEAGYNSGSAEEYDLAMKCHGDDTQSMCQVVLALSARSSVGGERGGVGGVGLRFFDRLRMSALAWGWSGWRGRV